MARIAGIDLPKNKRVEIGLTYIYGIGKHTSQQILSDADIDFNVRIKDLTEDEVSKIATIINKVYKTEGDLRREVNQNIKRLMEIKSYRGSRHKNSLPSRGQRTKTNARTRRGKRTSISKSK